MKMYTTKYLEHAYLLTQANVSPMFYYYVPSYRIAVGDHRGQGDLCSLHTVGRLGGGRAAEVRGSVVGGKEVPSLPRSTLSPLNNVYPPPLQGPSLTLKTMARD